LLFAMMATESGAKVHAYSRAGAVGPLQFMPSTARRYGLFAIDGFDTRLDPVRATRANARYVIDHLRRLRGNLELTLAAYNAGETRLRKIHRAHPDKGFWDDEVYYALPFETRTYVPRVLAAALLYLHPERYGIRFPDGEADVTTIRLGPDASLGELAVCLGNAPGEDGWFRALRNLNPAISPSDRIPSGTRILLPTVAVDAYGERCVAATPWTLLARELHEADNPERPEVLRYTVRSGDSLAAIAQEHRSSIRELAELNRLRPPYLIHPGQQLTVPARK
jgi:membrane-bound lytic murein transglycosylase D